MRGLSVVSPYPVYPSYPYYPYPASPIVPSLPTAPIASVGPCANGYTRQVISYYPLQTACEPTLNPYGQYPPYGVLPISPVYDQYNYTSNLPVGEDPYIYYRDPTTCAENGGDWDSFSMSCSSANATGPGSASANPTPAGVPNVIGQNVYNAASMINSAGFTAWLVQSGDSYFNPPQGYLPTRVDLWADYTGTVQRQEMG